MRYPQHFDIDYLQSWYNYHFKEEIELEYTIDERRRNIAKNIFDKEEDKKDSIFTALFNCIEASLESSLQDFDIHEPLNYEPSKLPKNKTEFDKKFIKSKESILNKFWRINKELPDEKKITLEVFLNGLKDLVRFSLKADNLKIAERFAKEIEKIPKIKSNKAVKNFNDTYLEKVVVDNELKMISGYFAYHCYFHFKDSFTIELQIFSELSNYWRKVSHDIYSTLRDSPKEIFKFNDVESRVVAVGHLLYLADCELTKIEDELKNK